MEILYDMYNMHWAALRKKVPTILHIALTHIEDNWLHEEPASEYNNNNKKVPNVLRRCRTKRRTVPPFFWYDTDF